MSEEQELEIQWETVKIKIGDIKPYKNNPRYITDTGYENLRISMLQDGYHQLIEVNTDMTLIAGHQRLKVMENEFGWKEDKIIEARIPERLLTEKEFKRHLLRSNQKYGSFDYDMLADCFEMDELFDSFFTEEDLLGDMPDVEEVEGEEDEETIPEKKSDPITVLGDVYQLGNHRLVCGDATMIDDVEKLMNGQKAAFVFADPPYNLNYKYNTYKDDKTRNEYVNFCKEWFANLIIISNGNIILTPGKQNIDIWYEIKKPLDIAIWIHKNGVSGCKTSMLSLWEPILFFGVFDRKSRVNNLFEYELKRQDIGDTGKEHSCPKQISLIRDIVRSYSKQNDLIYDPFLGSGTTLIAAESTNRICYGMELDPLYCDVIVKRYINFMEKNNKPYEVICNGESCIDKFKEKND